jgi:uncharacterized protein YdaU (DUF1376 family)
MANPWYAFYAGDYRRDTAHLSLLQDGAYRRLLDYCYSTGKPIPTHVEQVFRICSAFVPEEQAAVRFILDEFFTLRDDGWHNPRVDRELAKVHEIREKRSKAGRESARKRKPTHVEHMFTQPQPQSQPHSQPEKSRAREETEGASKLLAPQVSRILDEGIFDDDLGPIADSPGFQTLAQKTKFEPDRESLHSERNRQIRLLQARQAAK